MASTGTSVRVFTSPENPAAPPAAPPPPPIPTRDDDRELRIRQFRPRRHGDRAAVEAVVAVRGQVPRDVRGAADPAHEEDVPRRQLEDLQGAREGRQDGEVAASRTPVRPPFRLFPLGPNPPR